MNSDITLDSYMTFFTERKCFDITNEIAELSDENIFLLTKIGLPSQLVNDYIVVNSIEIVNSRVVLARDKYLSENCIYFDFNIDKNKLFFNNSHTIFSNSLQKGMLLTLTYCLFYNVYNIMYKERYSKKLNSQLIKQYIEKYESLFEFTKSRFNEIDKNLFIENSYWHIWKTIVEEEIEIEKFSAQFLNP